MHSIVMRENQDGTGEVHVDALGWMMEIEGDSLEAKWAHAQALLTAMRNDWDVIGTGGGCTALYGSNELQGGPYVLITEEGGIAVPRTVGAPIIVGLFNAEGEEMKSVTVVGVAEAVKQGVAFLAEV